MGAKSYRLMKPPGKFKRGQKCPGTPSPRASTALAQFIKCSQGDACLGPVWQSACQNDFSLSERCSGGLPAIIAAVMAPIEDPASQFGWRPRPPDSALYIPAW
jgi:hypothetical protein